jgi:hypothetical protein
LPTSTIVVGRDVGATRALGLATRRRLGLESVALDGVHARLQGLDPGALVRAEVLGDEDLGGDGELAGDRCDGQRVIAGRCRDDAARGLGLRQGQQLVGGAPQLEGTGLLEILEFQEYLRGRRRAQRRREPERRLADVGPDAPFGRGRIHPPDSTAA